MEYLLVMAVFVIGFMARVILKRNQRIEQLGAVLRETRDNWQPPFAMGRNKSIILADKKEVMRRRWMK